MEAANLSSADKFVLVGFSDIPRLQVPLFVLFLLIYLLTLVGNVLIVATIFSNSKLHSPMYFFLTNLSFIDICYTSNIFPHMLAHFFEHGTHISLIECLFQDHVALALLSIEVLILTIMAYDRYVAICNPLRYTTIMNNAFCVRLSAESWAAGLLIPLIHTLLASKLSFCRTHTINHFFCDLTALMKISCSSTLGLELASYVAGTTFTLMTCLLIIISYINIISCILKMNSKEGRWRTFSTCGSHLTVVILFYSSICSMYMRPASTYSMETNKILALLYGALTPLCNPIIYSLKNAEFKNALKASAMFQC